MVAEFEVMSLTVNTGVSSCVASTSSSALSHADRADTHNAIHMNYAQMCRMSRAASLLNSNFFIYKKIKNSKSVQNLITLPYCNQTAFYDIF